MAMPTPPKQNSYKGIPVIRARDDSRPPDTSIIRARDNYSTPTLSDEANTPTQGNPRAPGDDRPNDVVPPTQLRNTPGPPDMKSLLTDARFQALPVTERHRFLLRNYPDYAALPPDQQRAFFMRNAIPSTSGEQAVGQEIKSLFTGLGRTAVTLGRALHTPVEGDPRAPLYVQARVDAANMGKHMITDPIHELWEGKRPDESVMTEPSGVFPFDPVRMANAGATILGANMPEARQAKERGDAGAQLAHTLTVPLLTAGFGRLLRGPKEMKVVPTRGEISALQSLAPRAVTGLGPADAAARTAEIQALLKQVAAEQGVTDATVRRTLAQSEHAPASDLVGDVGRGNQRVFDLVKGAVDFAQRPLDAVMQRYGKQPPAGVPWAVSQDLYAKAAEVGKVNPALSKALRALADKARAATNFGELNDIKVHANKMADDLYSPIPGKQINASAETAYAYRAAADAIRQRMYPALQQASGGTLDLSALGRREADAIAFRDGVMEHYYSQVAPAQANMGAANFLEYTLAGEGAPGHSYYTRHMQGRALEKAGVIPGGGGKMNKAMRRGIGPIGEGMTPEAVVEKPAESGIPQPPANDIAAASSVNSPADVARLQEAAAQRLFSKSFKDLPVADKFIALREATKMQAAERAGMSATQPPSISISPYKPGRTPRGTLARNKGRIAGVGVARTVSAGIPPPPSPDDEPPDEQPPR